MKFNAAIPWGFALDLLLADPEGMPHPVGYMGRAITALEGVLRPRLPKTPGGELLGGAVLAAALPAGTFAAASGACRAARRLHPAAGFRSVELHPYSSPLFQDTQELTAEGVTKAAVETVAENFSDGVAAPLFYLLIGGAPLALAYKAVNTMDSMVGYKNDRYLYFGRAAARLDDAANYLPSRLAALCWIGGAFLTGQDGRGAWRIWRRDRRNHASPNSAQTESACAGALGVQLAGPASYFGKRVDKPAIGDPGRPVEPEDIARANRTLYAAGGLALGAGLLARAVLGRRRA